MYQCLSFMAAGFILGSILTILAEVAYFTISLIRSEHEPILPYAPEE